MDVAQTLFLRGQQPILERATGTRIHLRLLKSWLCVCIQRAPAYDALGKHVQYGRPECDQCYGWLHMWDPSCGWIGMLTGSLPPVIKTHR